MFNTVFWTELAFMIISTTQMKKICIADFDRIINF